MTATRWTSVLVMLLATAAAAAAEPVELIANGGFEEGLAGWNPDAGYELIDGGGVARSGRACLAGEVSAPNKHLTLIKRVQVNSSSRYTFSFWAKAAGGTKVVLWAVQPGADRSVSAALARKMVASFDKLPNQWRRYACPVSAEGNGTLELQIIAPSSHGAPPGRVWLDDISLEETGMPAFTPISGGEGFNDEPALAAADDGTLYAAYISFAGGSDSLQVARFRSQGERFERLGKWQIAGGPKTYLLGTCAVSAGANVFVLYAAEVKQNWDVYAVRCGADGPDKPIRVTTGPEIDIKPAAAWDGERNRLWIAWESNPQGERQIFATHLSGGEVAEACRLSEKGCANYEPSIAVSGTGLCVAWHAFRENNHDIYLSRSRMEAGLSSGAWQPAVRLTTAPTIDRHARLFAHAGKFWLLYENAQMGTPDRPYRIGSTRYRRLVLGQLNEDIFAPVKLLAPQGYAAQSPLAGRCEAPEAAFDSTGRLWVVYRQPDENARAWDVLATCFDGEKWQKPNPVSHLRGMDRRPALALAGGWAVVAYQADANPKSFASIEEAEKATSDVYLAGFDLGQSRPAAPMDLVPLAESSEEYPPGSLRVQFGEDLPTPTVEYKGEKLNLYFGDLHEHTEVSICNRLGDESIDESYQNMRDIAAYDFACVTDHGYNHCPYTWSHTAKLARVNDDPNRFLTFLAEEWTSTFEEYSREHPFGFYGHRNLILVDSYSPRWWNARNRQTPAEIWEDLRKLKANFVNIPHQLADTGNVPTDWNFIDEEAQPVAEIFQIRGSYEYKGAPREAARTTLEPGYFLQDAWARGIVIGVIASPDHGGGYGKACVFAPQLSREAILDALRARRCYGTTAAKIFLDVRVDGRLMGEKLAEEAGRSVEVCILARCPGAIDRIEVCRNNQFIYISRPEGREAELTFTDQQPLKGFSYYYVRLVQKDEEIAWTSPVWFGAK